MKGVNFQFALLENNQTKEYQIVKDEGDAK